MAGALRRWLHQHPLFVRWVPSQVLPAQAADIPGPLWQSVMARYPFLAALETGANQRLRHLAAQFLARKEFSGAGGFVITDEVALCIAAQAVLPLLYLRLGLQWYGGFVGIVVHPGAVRARRVVTDEAGLVHAYTETLTGEAMQGGPLMLSWSDVANAGTTAVEGYNVVIHEFIHVIDMQAGPPNGCPPLAARARRAWLHVMQAEYESFCEQCDRQARFGGPPAPLLDCYGATHIAEFFAVAAEAYFVRRVDFAAAYPALLAQFDGFFRPLAGESIE